MMGGHLRHAFRTLTRRYARQMSGIFTLRDRLRSVRHSTRCPYSVAAPGGMHTALQRPGKIPDIRRADARAECREASVRVTQRRRKGWRRWLERGHADAKFCKPTKPAIRLGQPRTLIRARPNTCRRRPLSWVAPKRLTQPTLLPRASKSRAPHRPPYPPTRPRCG